MRDLVNDFPILFFIYTYNCHYNYTPQKNSNTQITTIDKQLMCRDQKTRNSYKSLTGMHEKEMND